MFLSNHPMFGAQLEVDGRAYRWDGPVRWSGPSHSSSKFRDTEEEALKITLDDNWKQIHNRAGNKHRAKGVMRVNE